MRAKSLFFILFITIQFNTFAQSRLFNQDYNEFLDFGLTEAELAEEKEEGELIIFNEAKHKTRLALTLFDKKVGRKHKEKGSVGTKVYEVVAERKIEHYRINYIFLDGDKMSKKAVDRLRNKILEMLDNGIQFESIARQYSMDNNAYNGGDSGWFKKEKTVPIFFDKISDPKLLANEVYSLDLPEANWYYLVKKTFTPSTIREILVKIED